MANRAIMEINSMCDMMKLMMQLIFLCDKVCVELKSLSKMEKVIYD